MEAFGFRGCLLAFIGVFVCFSAEVSAQESVSSASVSRSRAISNANVASPRNRSNSSSRASHDAVNFTPPDEVAVEEFINYHRHRLPLPKAGQAVAMDVRWGN